MQLFSNDVALEVGSYESLGALDLAAFPVVKDFRVLLQHGGTLGWHVHLVSTSRGILAGFPWWDHAERELKTWKASDVLTGTAEMPLLQSGEAWQVIVFEQEGQIYVLEGEEPETREFGRYFAVPQDRWEAAWMRAAAACKAGRPKEVAL
jgi:hypothetical protein